MTVNFVLSIRIGGDVFSVVPESRLLPLHCAVIVTGWQIIEEVREVILSRRQHNVSTSIVASRHMMWSFGFAIYSTIDMVLPGSGCCLLPSSGHILRQPPNRTMYMPQRPHDSVKMKLQIQT